tara:strand:+ start:212 stop:643 length:432 start_codon:yes stop_codon:yes gene_type:complete
MIFINYFIKEDGLILGLLDIFKDVSLISFGAVLGANTRFIIYKKLDQLNLSKNLIILLINISSSFFLGLFLSILSQIGSVSYTYQLVLFFSIGLLGSLSTFSTFIYDLYDLFVQLKFYIAFKLFLISLMSGLLAFAVGFSLGI